MNLRTDLRPDPSEARCTDRTAPGRPAPGASGARAQLRPRAWAVVAIAALAPLAAAGCSAEERRGPPALPPPGVEAAEPLAFEDAAGLLEAIEAGEFVEVAGIEELVEVASLPPPMQIEFVGGTDVPEDQMPELEELAASLARNERIRVDLIGCSDPSGPEDVNLRISRQRAQSVASALRELGVAEQRIGDVFGRGEACTPQVRMVKIEARIHEPDADRQARTGAGGGAERETGRAEG